MTRSHIAGAIAILIIVAGLVVLGILITGTLEGAAQCGGDLLRNCQ